MKKLYYYSIAMASAIGILMLLSANNSSHQNTQKLKTSQPNLYEIQEAFYASWKGRNPESGMGYKQFKRWEYFMKSRVSSNGDIPDMSVNIKEAIKEQERANRQSSSCTVNANWTELGPRRTNEIKGSGQLLGQNGRINCIAFHPTNNIPYVGASTGGVWIRYD